MSIQRLSVVLFLLVLPWTCFAQSDPVGRWKTIDDETGKPKSIVEIYKATNGTLVGKVVEVLKADKPNPVCEKCSGANKNKPIKGMIILWGLKAVDATHWDSGTVLDPSKGKTYKSKIELAPDGGKLEMSGCISFFCRGQTWIRQ